MAIEHKGEMFNRPDSTGNLKYSRVIDPETNSGWGNIFTPDELRRIWFFGNSKLSTMNGDQYSDDMLNGIIEQYTLAIQEELQHDILPIQWRHRPQNASQTREIEDHARWQDLRDFKTRNNVQQNFYVRVRKPVLKLQKFTLQDPYSTQLLIDLLPTAQINYSTGEIRSAITGMYPAYGGILTAGLPLAGRMFGMRAGLGVPNGFLVDHVSGYDRANRVPRDLVNFIQKTIAVHLLSRYGDGIVGGLANFSVSAGVIHESVGTTMSASIDGNDTVRIRKRFSDGVTSPDFKIKIQDFFSLFHGDDPEIKYGYYETLAVNPRNITEFGWRKVTDAILHDSSRKNCYYVYVDNYSQPIGITEDHSLFRIENNRLIEIKGAQLSQGDTIAGFSNSNVINMRVKKKVKYRPAGNRVFDLSVDKWENFLVNDHYIAHNTSGYFGATILQFTNELKEIYPKIQAKYTGIEYAIL